VAVERLYQFSWIILPLIVGGIRPSSSPSPLSLVCPNVVYADVCHCRIIDDADLDCVILSPILLSAW